MNIFMILVLIFLGIAVMSIILSLCFSNNETALLVFVSLTLGGLLLSWIFLGIFAWIVQSCLYLIVAILGCACLIYLIISFIMAVI